MGSRKTLIHWFRQDLRVHDNPALAHIFALAYTDPAKYRVRPIFILSSNNTETPSVGANRCRFLQQALEDLNKQLEELNSRLYVVRGAPAEVIPLLFLEWQNIECLTLETAIEPHAKDVDALITDLAEKQGIKVLQFFSRTLYNPEEVLKNNLGKAPLTYQKFLSLVENMKVPTPLEALERLPITIISEQKNPNCYDCPSIAELVKCPDELGMNKFPGGETEALQRLEAIIKREQWLCDFEKNNTAPNSLEPSSTALSPYLNFGCLSTRLFYKRINDVLKKHPIHTKPPVSLLGQLLWREFYYTAAASEPNFDRMLGNSLCLQIPWTRNDEFLQAWTNGCTGYPFIDAIMRQLRQEGWIHHLARHAVACFLTRGDLWISWEEGERVFEELLIDYDWALNAANWMFLSASAFYHKYFHVYSPVAYGRKTDPTGNYIRKYVPELAKYPSGTIYEPWKVSEKAQCEYGCVLGVDYPHRIVQHETVHKENIKKMTAAYKVNKEVRTGKSEEICDEETVVGTKRKAKSTTASSKKTKRK